MPKVGGLYYTEHDTICWCEECISASNSRTEYMYNNFYDNALVKKKDCFEECEDLDSVHCVICLKMHNYYLKNNTDKNGDYVNR
jgi:hypothetical protein